MSKNLPALLSSSLPAAPTQEKREILVGKLKGAGVWKREARAALLTRLQPFVGG